jgi:hypothetical protein
MGYAKRPLMDMSTWKSEKECMASHKPASLPTNFSNSGWHAMDISNYPTHLASGNVLHSLCVDYFGIKYVGDEHLNHLFAALRTETYEIVEDWKSDLSCGISLTWNYNK